MPRPVCITYDSTCDLTPQLLERFHIRTIPLTIQSGGRVFPDDGNYTSAELYTDYRRNGTLPKTTAISPEAFKAFFSPLLAEGYDIVHIDISSELSCTCQNAVLAAQELTDQGQIHVVDSRQLSTGGGLLALQGAKLRDSGMAAVDIAAELERIRKEIEKAQNGLRGVEQKLSNEKFVSRAPEAVVNAEREKAAKYKELIAKLEESAKAMQA